ncbi:MAG: hypothetical protein ACYTG5_09000 [Planctomycetota bacterium]|jgi:hypothetical protein
MNSLPARASLLACLTLAGSLPAQFTDPPIVRDHFNRDISNEAITLVDWEGHLANPMIRFRVAPPPGAPFPILLTLSANDPRLYFEVPSQQNAQGPTRNATYLTTTPFLYRMSIFPDRDGDDEVHELLVKMTGPGYDQELRIPIHVIDQDQPANAPDFQITVDYSEDLSGFYSNQDARAVIDQIVADWAYFLHDPGYDPVSTGAQPTWIWDWPHAWTAPSSGHWVNNAAPYQGFLLYLYGIRTPELRSGGNGSTSSFQTIGNQPTSLRRAGTVETEVRGNFNQLGWIINVDPDAWWVTGNLSGQMTDLATITHHEVGHALGFSGVYPEFASAQSGSGVTSPEIVAYYGGPVPINPGVAHFTGIVDPASRRGIFGNEYGGSAPARRWLTTKLDLLLLDAIGWDLRPNSSLVTFTATPETLPQASCGTSYSHFISASGGIPGYDFRITSGELPVGLELNRFTGEVHGMAHDLGRFEWVVQVLDQAEPPKFKHINLAIDVTCASGSHRAFGTGCAGAAGVPSLDLAPAEGPPALGAEYSLVLSQVPDSGIGLGIVGLSQTSWGAFDLPVDLSIIGTQPSCLLYTDLRRQIPLMISGGQALWNLEIPSGPDWLGVEFFQQAAVVDLSLPGLPIVMSNAMSGIIGN